MGLGPGFTNIVSSIKAKIKANEKLKVPIIMVVIGVGIMLVFPNEKDVPAFSEEKISASETDSFVHQQLAEILSAVDGAGQVKVMLTVCSDGVTEYQTDVEEIERNGETVVKSTTVFGGSTAESALVIRKTASEYMGAVVVAEGAGSAEVRYNLTKAVSSLTGLPVNRITVLKMK